MANGKANVCNYCLYLKCLLFCSSSCILIGTRKLTLWHTNRILLFKFQIYSCLNSKWTKQVGWYRCYSLALGFCLCAFCNCNFVWLERKKNTPVNYWLNYNGIYDYTATYTKPVATGLITNSLRKSSITVYMAHWKRITRNMCIDNSRKHIYLLRNSIWISNKNQKYMNWNYILGLPVKLH